MNKMKEILEKQQYRIVGDHSAVKICHWTKKSLKDEGVCYKQKFYGIESHRCLQMTPCLSCNFWCRFCWRAHPPDLGMKREEMPQKWDDPSDIIEGCIEKQRELLSGFKGNEKVNILKWKEAQKPNQAAISLTGEPTLYPRIDELIDEFKRRGFTTFLVTNGSRPGVLERIPEPTCLYISLDAPDEELFRKVDLPQEPKAWENLNRSLSLLKSFSCNTIVRITLIKGLNMIRPEGYAQIIEKYEPKYVEVKAFMPVGYSQYRLGFDQMPSHSEVKEFSRKISENCGYNLIDEQEESRVVLLAKGI